jgi:predicted secreted protein
MRYAIRSALTVAAALAASAAMAQPHADFGPKDNGRMVRLFNPIFTVELPENASTGYHWQVEPNRSHNVVVLKAQSSTLPHPPGMVGVGGARVFTLRSTAMRGDVTIGYIPPGRGRLADQVFHLGFASGYGSGEHGPM